MIWTLNKAKLYDYIPVVPPEKRHKVPLFLVFALMNKPYILDLRPGNSFIEYMVKQGFDIYLLDWGNPGPEDKDLKFDNYVLDYLPRAIRKVKAVSGSDEFSMLGWCIGAILATIYAALRPDDGLKNLILLTAPLDFTDLVFREKTVIGSMSGYGLFDEAIRMMGDPRFKGSVIITQRIRLQDLIEEGFRPLLTEKHKHVKTLVSPR